MPWNVLFHDDFDAGFWELPETVQGRCHGKDTATENG